MIVDIRQPQDVLKVLLGIVIWCALIGAPVMADERVVPKTDAQVKLSYAPVVKEVAPAVVNVYSQRVVQTRVSPFFNDPFFERFFGGDWGGVPKNRIQNSLGSGVIVSENGIIVTNNHVIAGGQEFRVVLADRREFEAELLLADERTDLAVLRIDPGTEKMPVVTFGDSDETLVGDIVLAIGNPFGVGQTVTSGIVSAVARTQQGISDYGFFIQTDAAINPGNSGGALVDISGKLIGINTAIFSRSGGSNGIGFAVPTNMVRRVVETAEAGGTYVERPWVGVRTQVVTSEIAQSLGLDRPRGVLITELHPESPFAMAKLAVGDVILNVGGFDIFDAQGLNYRIGSLNAGDTAKITYHRKEKTREATIKLTKAPRVPASDLTALDGTHPLSGATVANLSPAFAEEMGFDWAETGVVISQLSPEGTAGRLGFRKGDVIVKVNGADISSVDDLQTVIGERQTQWAYVVRRGGRLMNFSFRL